MPFKRFVVALGFVSAAVALAHQLVTPVYAQSEVELWGAYLEAYEYTVHDGLGSLMDYEKEMESSREQGLPDNVGKAAGTGAVIGGLLGGLMGSTDGHPIWGMASGAGLGGLLGTLGGLFAKNNDLYTLLQNRDNELGTAPADLRQMMAQCQQNGTSTDDCEAQPQYVQEQQFVDQINYKYCNEAARYAAAQGITNWNCPDPADSQ